MGVFVSLNRFHNRIGFNKLREHCIKFKPLHTYMSILNWLMPERVGEKTETRRERARIGARQKEATDLAFKGLPTLCALFVINPVKRVQITSIGSFSELSWGLTNIYIKVNCEYV
jgi:hypothetical protein